MGLSALSRECVRLILARRDQIAQTALDERAPGARAIAVALKCGNKAHMRKAQLGLAGLLDDFKNNVSTDPLGLVLEKGQVGVRNMPHYLPARNQFRHVLPGDVKVLVAVSEFGANLVGIAHDLSRPPTANVVDCIENFFGSLVNRKRCCKTIFFHDSNLHPLLLLNVSMFLLNLSTF